MRDLLRALSYGKQLWPYYLSTSVIAILSSATYLAMPYIMKNVTDGLVGSADIAHQTNLVIGAAILLFVFDAANAALRNLGGYLSTVLAAKLQSTLSVSYYRHILSLPQSYFDGEISGKIVNRLNRAITSITGFLNVMTGNLLPMLITSVLTLIIFARYSWFLALMIMALYPIFLGLTYVSSRRWQRLQHKINRLADTATGHFNEAINQIKVVKSFTREASELSRFQRQFASIVGLTRRQTGSWHKIDVSRSLVLAAIFFGIFIFIFDQTARQRFSVGDMIFLTLLLNQIRMPLFSLSFLIDSFQRAVTGSKDFVETMSIVPAISDREDAADLIVKSGEINFDDVWFAYQPEKSILSGVSFSVPPGQKVALVGISGAGKSTIAHLLLRMYEPNRGKITIDGQDITTVTQNSLRRNVAVVFQDPAVFSGTIYDNIAYGKDGASADEIEAAARAIGIDQFIESLPKGYHTEIGERGIKLSGGQKQRLAIARAYLKGAPILILDEATSSLDSRAEQEVQLALQRLMQGRTSLVIAHRLSTIRDSDLIITLRHGKVDEIGSPAELAHSGGVYNRLLDLQQQATSTSQRRLREYDIGD